MLPSPINHAVYQTERGMLTSKLVEIIFESRRQFNCRIYHFMPRQLSLPETTKIDHHASLPLQAVYKYHNAGLLLFSIFNQRQTKQHH